MLVPADVDGTLSALTDGLLVLRYLFGRTAITTGATGAGCTRCESDPILAYLGTLD
jgi:hypothetical protein